jgi:cobalt/nickel transport system ATP-binding protein
VEDVNALEVAGLSYRYPDGTTALRELTFAVAEGERVGLIGPNGAGKSTLLLHLNGLLPEHPSAPPAVRVLGTPVAEPHLAEIRARVGLLFQDPDDQLFCPTVWEDVAFGPQQWGVNGAEIAGRVTRALEQVGLQGFDDRPPHRLSRGEKAENLGGTGTVNRGESAAVAGDATALLGKLFPQPDLGAISNGERIVFHRG